MDIQTRLQRWERHSEWPLASAALIFLGVFTVEVLAEPHGHEAHVLWLISWITWGLFIVDYVARLWLAADRRRWFSHRLLDFAIVTLPLLRPLRLLRLIILIEVLQKAVGDAMSSAVRSANYDKSYRQEGECSRDLGSHDDSRA
jgi:voltage-gated potassium channel